jgi:hypothetical protein
MDDCVKVQCHPATAEVIYLITAEIIVRPETCKFETGLEFAGIEMCHAFSYYLFYFF